MRDQSIDLLRKTLNELLTYISELKEEFVESNPNAEPCIICNIKTFLTLKNVAKVMRRSDIGDEPLTGDWKLQVLGMPIIIKDYLSNSEVLVVNYFEHQEFKFSR